MQKLVHQVEIVSGGCEKIRDICRNAFDPQDLDTIDQTERINSRTNAIKRRLHLSCRQEAPGEVLQVKLERSKELSFLQEATQRVQNGVQGTKPWCTPPLNPRKVCSVTEIWPSSMNCLTKATPLQNIFGPNITAALSMRKYAIIQDLDLEEIVTVQYTRGFLVDLFAGPDNLRLADK